jgi:hypothetical protein
MVEVEKHGKYDLLVKELGVLGKFRARIIPYVMTWDGVVKNFHRKQRNDLGITSAIEAYIQSRIVRTTLEAISLERIRGKLDGSSKGGPLEETAQELGNDQARIWVYDQESLQMRSI